MVAHSKADAGDAVELLPASSAGTVVMYRDLIIDFFYL
jgi:hypothetical protein